MNQKIKTFLYQVLTVTIAILIFANVPVTWFNLTKFFQTQRFGSTITTLNSTDVISNFPSTYNTNLANLNSDKFENNSYGSLLTIASSTIGSLVTGVFTATSTTASSTAAFGITATGFGATGTSTLKGIQLAGGSCITYNGTCLTNAVSTVANSDSTLTVSPTTGNVIASINLAHSNVWTALQAHSYTATSTWSNDINSGGLIAAAYFDATSTTATSTMQALKIIGTATTTNMVISGNCKNCANNLETKTNTGGGPTGSNSGGGVTATCTSGKTVIAGGGTDSVGSLRMYNSYPDSSSSWSVNYWCETGGCPANTITAYAVCVNN